MQRMRHWISTWNGLLWNWLSSIWHFLTSLPFCSLYRARQCCQFYLFFPECTLNSLTVFISSFRWNCTCFLNPLSIVFDNFWNNTLLGAEISHAASKLEVRIVLENLGRKRTPLIHLWGLGIPISVCTFVFDDLLIPIKSTPLFFPPILIFVFHDASRTFFILIVKGSTSIFCFYVTLHKPLFCYPIW